MANYVIVTAGGTGSRMHKHVPKQFISVNDEPIIMYTLKAFQEHPQIDGIVVPCLSGWDNYLETYSKMFGITKLIKIVDCGDSGFRSIKNGLDYIYANCNKDDIVLIHDGNRPGVSAETITNCINEIKEKGTAITYIPTNEVVYDISCNPPKLLNRDNIIRTQTPHGARLQYMYDIYERAIKENCTDSVAFCSLLTKFNEPVNFVLGGEKNFKITYPDELDIFKGMVNKHDKNV